MGKMKRTILALMFLTLLGLPLSAYANHGKWGGHCGKGGGGSCSKAEEKSPCPITNRFFWQAHEMLEHQKELDLNAEQVKAVKDLKLEVRKQSVQQMANMQVFMIDLESKLSESKLDTEGLNAFIDSGMTSMATSAKQVLAAYGKLQAILTPDQQAKFKTVR